MGLVEDGAKHYFMQHMYAFFLAPSTFSHSHYMYPFLLMGC
jgi:hypothetical protein